MLVGLVSTALAAPWIVGGEPVPAGMWLDAAGIEYPWGVGCTGTLIAPDLVLTAGHCAFGAATVVVGTNDYAVGGERISIAATFIHPDAASTFDVAVFVLAAPAQTPPRPIALDCVAEGLADGAAVVLVGYGAIDEGATEFSSALMQGLTTVDDADCSDLTRGCAPLVAPGGEFVAGGGGVDTCTGDSGGPAYLVAPDGAWLAGVTSRAAAPSTRPCGDGGIYVRADAVAAWIEATTGEVLARPACADWNHAPEPTVASIEVRAGERAEALVIVDDPDPGDRHAYAIAAPPADGHASIDGLGRITYDAPFSPGPDDFDIAVTDDGEPPLTAVVTVLVYVEEVPPEVRVEGGCSGCGTGARGSRSALIAAAYALGRRRRGQVAVHEVEKGR